MTLRVPRGACQEGHAGSEIGWALGQFSSGAVVEQLLGGKLKTAGCYQYSAGSREMSIYLQERLQATVISQTPCGLDAVQKAS